MEALERYTTTNDLLTIVIILTLLLLVISKKLYENRFEDFTSLFTSGKYLIIKNREHKALFGFNVLMLSIHILSISILLFVIYRLYLKPSPEDSGIIFLRILTAYGSFVLVKITVEKIIANIFDIDETAENYLFQKHTYRNFLSLLILPVSVFLIYSTFSGKALLFILGITIIVGVAYSLYNVVKKNHSLFSRNWFYFILYLCALEITPYVIMYKLITTSTF